MCGLWGAVGPSITNSDVSFLRDLAIISQLRGSDSTGLVVGYDEGKEKLISYHKNDDNSSNFLNEKETIELFNEPKSFLLAGHCRAATVGVVNKENAHPFHTAHIVGMHNGTLPSLKGRVNGEVVPDSRILFDLIAKVGLTESLDRCKNGAYALCYVDSLEKKLNFIRNKERPLYFLNRSGTIFWASEYAFLAFTRARHGVLDNLKIEPLVEDMLFEYDLINHTYKISEVERPQKVSLCPAPKKENVEETKKEITKKSNEEVKGYYTGFRGKKMTITKAKNLLNRGCSFSADDVGDIDSDVYWINNSDYVMARFIDDEFVKAFLDIKESSLGTLVLYN